LRVSFKELRVQPCSHESRLQSIMLFKINEVAATNPNNLKKEIRLTLEKGSKDQMSDKLFFILF